jgi:predicted RNA binding protein YcfA (HicA-like mRNA interferase family)
MLNELDNFYFQQEEPLKGCLLALREIILEHDSEITEAWKYNTPFFCFRKKNICYLWMRKKNREPYIGFVKGRYLEHPKLVHENRSQVKTLAINPHKDIPVGTVNAILKAALRLYK